MPQAQLIIFDCDGVLVDSEGIKSEVVARHLGNLGIAITGKTLIERFSGVPDREMYQALSIETGVAIPPEHVAEAFALKISHCGAKGEALAIPGIHECLDALAEASVCVASSASPNMLEQMLRQARLWDRFAPNIFSAHEVKRGKPAPDLFLLAAARMAVLPAHCLIVEDSVAGVTAAKAAAMTAIGFAGGCHCGPDHADKLRHAGARTVFMEMASLTEHLVKFTGA
ncbi:MAG: HAD-IA family hydrolase [Hyphomicrobiales bacterium]|nr:HAD-IA family hydrolase [Hyphomicrobiales bacterium]MBV8824942.1 HAD-IA family hydrolase [Hyphomicrobiales bacterium]MBV9426545.1 HAD-IA family hydrolase [Bradyrhizobiaceae bacterium]